MFVIVLMPVYIHSQFVCHIGHLVIQSTLIVNLSYREVDTELR